MLKHIPFYASLIGRDIGRDMKATNSHVLIYGAIEAHSYGQKGCIASNATLAAETGLAVGTVKNALTHISSAGWISIEYQDAEKNVRGSITPLLEISTPSLYSDTPSFPSDTPVTVQLHPRHCTVTRGNSLGNSEETDRVGFEEFWTEYPRKTAKVVAQRSWKRLSKKEKERAVVALRSWLKSEQWLKDGGRYVPHPATFLNQKRFEDELPKEITWHKQY
jgi:hypothetical protein